MLSATCISLVAHYTTFGDEGVRGMRDRTLDEIWSLQREKSLSHAAPPFPCLKDARLLVLRNIFPPRSLCLWFYDTVAARI
jgi:hypothetical protein